MKPALLAVNSGSSSLKIAVFTADDELVLLRNERWTGQVAGHEEEWRERIGVVLQGVRLSAIGHRVVHGGPEYHEPQLVMPSLLLGLQRLVALAPNHLPGTIGLIEALQRACSGVPHVACFDTGFHHELPEVTRRLPIPRSFDARGVRRYGFHGLSYEYVLQELQTTEPALARAKVVIAHLGSGSSLVAVNNGRSMDTSMSLTPLGGTMMSTRSGDLDPGLVAFVMRSEALTADQIEDLFGQRSGLFAVSGSSGDMRQLLEREATDTFSRLAVDMFAYQIKKCIGAYAAALGGLDALIFTGGVGEHAAEVRSRICAGLEFLGLYLDQQLNALNHRTISVAGAPVAVRVIPTNEELMIARATMGVLGRTS